MKLSKEEKKAFAHIGKQIKDQSDMLWAEILVERLENIRIKQNKYSMTLDVYDLKQILSAFEDNSELTVPLRIAYYIWIGCGIKLKGFHPNKTALRTEYKLPLEKINELLPGSYKVTKSWRNKSE